MGEASQVSLKVAWQTGDSESKQARKCGEPTVDKGLL